jgi:hypothetical protein
LISITALAHRIDIMVPLHLLNRETGGRRQASVDQFLKA